MPRFFCPTPLTTGAALALPAGAARHVQVLRLQPGDTITLFNGQPPGGEFEATITHMGRSDVQIEVGAHRATECEPRHHIHLAVGMPANDRMDWLVEKATELGVASIQPLMSERSVLRLTGERADKKVAHWQSIAVAACEQCGGNRMPTIHPMQSLASWLKAAPVGAPAHKMLLSLAAGSTPLHTHATVTTTPQTLCFLSGPEGGLSPSEEALAIATGFLPVSLGPRVLRAETAALAALTLLTLSS